MIRETKVLFHFQKVILYLTVTYENIAKKTRKLYRSTYFDSSKS